MVKMPAMVDELIEEFLLRLPPAEPAGLVDAALVCKSWCRFICGPHFRRRFREFHRAPPMLGFFCNITIAQFFPTSSFRVPQSTLKECSVLDARHGRVLLEMNVLEDDAHLAVWDPTTDARWDIPQPDIREQISWYATVLCEAATRGSCDHLDCSSGSFIIIALGRNIGPEHMSFLHIYSSEAGTWSEPTPVPECHADAVSTALVGNTLYFLVDDGSRILSYDLAAHETSMIHLPPKVDECSTALMEMENGGLGIARLNEAAKLSLWSTKMNPNGDMEWAQFKVIELEKLLPVGGRSIYTNFIDFVHGVGVFFVGTDDGIFTFDLKSGRVKKVFEEPCEGYGVNIVVPYVSFYTPALRLVDTGEEPEVDAASA